ncbi:hypothetical protein [Rhodobacter capsulatus]|nr:hypothetical protein [Rhodobacter capsulatus]
MAYAAAPANSTLSVEDRAVAILMLLLQGKNAEARQAFFSDSKITKELRPAVAKALNESFLFGKNLEWTNHGVNRTFRFWSEEEKKGYMALAAGLIDCLKLLSPHVTFGFGAILGIVRDRNFIAHDDDLDLLIAMEPSTFTQAKAVLKEHLTAHGYTCHGENHSHFGVTLNQGRAVDVFIGFREADRVSWFPSRRKSLAWDSVFPASSLDWYGQTIPIPRNTDAYLEGTYGSDWRTPVSVWSHPWNIAEYRDIL